MGNQHFVYDAGKQQQEHQWFSLKMAGFISQPSYRNDASGVPIQDVQRTAVVYLDSGSTIRAG
jgi:hypothetical protein